MAVTKELWIAYTRIFFVELAYWIVSIGMVFVNEYVLSSNILTDDLTVFITIFQILFSLGILITLNYITKAYLYPQAIINSGLSPTSVAVNTNLIGDEENEYRDNLSEEEISNEQQTTIKPNINTDSLINLLIVNIPHRVNLETCKLVFPLSILYIGMLLLNNFCLKYVGVAFYFVSRSLTTVFNVAFTYFLMNEPVSRGSLCCCTLIVLGFFLGIDQENVIGSLSVIGVLFGVASSLFGSLFSIFTKKTLAKLDRNIWVLVLYNNINAIILCAPLLIVHGDVQALISDKVVSPSFWLLLSISGVMAFFISIVTNASIKYTSPLTHNISGTAKACLQTVIAVIYNHDNKSVLWWVSNVTILVASAVYSRIKQWEMEQKSATTNQSMSRKSRHDQGGKSLLKSKNRDSRRDSSSSSDGSIDTLRFGVKSKDNCSVKFQLSNSNPA